MNSSKPAAETGAAQAAPTRHPDPAAGPGRILIVDDRDEDATQILTVITERSCPMPNPDQEEQSQAAKHRTSPLNLPWRNGGAGSA